LGNIELKKEHPMTESTGSYKISQRLQDLMCLVGQQQVFEQGAQTLNQILGIELSDRQVQRVSEHYGHKIEEQMKDYDPELLPQVSLKNKEEPVYVMIDGSMVFTRERQWMEMKLGRIHSCGQTLDNEQDRHQLSNSVYVSHLGSYNDFFINLERYLIHYKHKVIVGDGAKWSWRWAEDNYPGATQILDYYHAIEKLAKFSSLAFTNNKEDHQEWLKTQKDLLLDNQVFTVMQNIRSTAARSPECKKSKQDVLRYYQEREDRMQYKTYKDQGLTIGSGSIESAHKNIIQQRAKLSGQRWSIKGVQSIINLRCMYKSNNPQCVRYLINQAA
jgi:hypothetical protein